MPSPGSFNEHGGKEREELEDDLNVYLLSPYLTASQSKGSLGSDSSPRAYSW